MGLKPIKDNHSRIIGYDFQATVKMYEVVSEMNKEENVNRTNEEILKKCGVSKTQWESWRNDYRIISQDPDGNITSDVNYFDDWFFDQLCLKPDKVRQVVYQAGLERALKDGPNAYQYWRDYARLLGVIDNTDQEDKRKIPQIKDNLNPEEIEDAKRKLLEHHKTMGGRESAGLARIAHKGRKSESR